MTGDGTRGGYVEDVTASFIRHQQALLPCRVKGHNHALLGVLLTLVPSDAQ